jgi:hypothetical protein
MFCYGSVWPEFRLWAEPLHDPDFSPMEGIA